MKTIDGGFLQSEEWRKFKEKTGLKTFFIGDDNFNASILQHVLPLKLNYFFIPRGPIFNLNKNIRENFQRVIDLAKENNISWIRVEPQSRADLEILKKNIDEFKFIKSAKNHQPPQTLVIDLQKSEDEILSNMKKKTRYNIKFSEKKNIVFESTRDKKDIDEFLGLIKITSTRNKIVNYEFDYYKNLFDFFDEKIIRLYVAKYEGKILAGIVSIFYKDTVTNLYGASSNEYRNLKAPYGLRWKIIKDVKEEGFKNHDLGGTKIIKNEKGENVPASGDWFGFSQIKLGFCYICEPIEFPGCYDIVLNSRKYWLYRILQKVKDFLNRFKK